MDGNLSISLDMPPLKRVDILEENGAERFPNDLGYDDKRVNLIRRIDFAWAVEKEDPSKKQKKSSTSSTTTTTASKDSPWPWQSLVENLQLAHQELSVIIDLINTVEANDAVTVAGMTRPKPLPNEHLADLSVSTATKLQCFRHLGKYFKQSAKALEKQIGREARFYGALIRLQQNWKVKRHRMAASTPGNEGFYIDLFDNSLFEPTAAFRPSLISTVWVEHDTGGMLALKLPSKARHSLQFGFVGASLVNTVKQSAKKKTYLSVSEPSDETKKELAGDDERVKETHSVLREVHRAIFDEQVFDLVNREAFIPSAGVNVTGIRENHLLLNIDQEASVFISLVPSSQADQIADSEGTNNENTLESSETLDVDGSNLEENKQQMGKKSAFPTQISCEILLQQIFQEHVFVKAKDKTNAAGGTQSYGQSRKDGNLLGHFCLSLAHRIFSNKVLIEMENVASKVPYVQLISYPTWHSRTSSWILSVEVPQTILHDGPQVRGSDKNVKSQFRTKVVVNDDCISVEGEGAPNVVGLFKGKYENICSINRFDCDLGDLPGILLQQVMATSKLIAVKAIDKRSRGRTINVRILRLWKREDTRYKKVTVEMLLMDDEGSKIQAAIPPSMSSEFKDMFKEGEMKKITNFGIEPNAITIVQKAIVNHEWKLSFGLATTASEVDTSVNISDNGFDFTPFSLFGSDPHKSVNADYVLDVIGEVVLPINDFEYVSAVKARKLDIKLVDNGGMELDVILWESYGGQLKSFIQNRGQDSEEPIVLILQFVMCSRYMGKSRVSTMKHATKLLINPDVPELKEFDKKRGNGVSSMGRSLTTITDDSKFIGGDEWFKIEDVKTINELLKCSEVGLYTTFAEIVDVDPHCNWYYQACSNKKCNKGVDRNSTKCPKCSTPYNNLIPRFKIKIVVIDGKDDNGAESYFMLFDACASNILNMSASQVVAEISESDQLPGTFCKMFGKKYLFRVEIDERTKDAVGDKRTFTVRKVTWDALLIDKYLSLTNSDEVASKLVSQDKNVSDLVTKDQDDGVEIIGDNCSTSCEQITPMKRTLDDALNSQDEQLSATKMLKEIKKEKVEK